MPAENESKFISFYDVTKSEMVLDKDMIQVLAMPNYLKKEECTLLLKTGVSVEVSRMTGEILKKYLNPLKVSDEQKVELV